MSFFSSSFLSLFSGQNDAGDGDAICRNRERGRRRKYISGDQKSGTIRVPVAPAHRLPQDEDPGRDRGGKTSSGRRDFEEGRRIMH